MKAHHREVIGHTEKDYGCLLRSGVKIFEREEGRFMGGVTITKAYRG